MALDTRGLASGFAQGFGLADNYYTRQEQGERADRRLDMQEETFEMQKQQLEQQQDQETAKFVFGKIANGMDLADEELQWLQNKPQYLAALNPEVNQALETAQRVIDPNDPLDLNDDEGLYAINTMFEPMINRGKGGRKRIAAGLPGRTEGTMAFELDVEGEDGTRYRAPMTRNRGVAGEDDEIREVPVESLVNTAQGYRVLRNVINTNGASENAAKLYSMLTGTKPEERETWSEPFEYQGGRYQRSKLTGELREVQSPEDVRKGTGAGDPSKPTWKQEIRAKRLSDEINHLWRMERQIKAPGSDGMTFLLGGMEQTVTPDNRDQLARELRTRIQANERELNKLLEVSEPQNPRDRIIEEARNVPPERREQEMADLKADPNMPYAVIKQIEEMWGMGGSAPAPDPQTDPDENQQSDVPPPPDSRGGSQSRDSMGQVLGLMQQTAGDRPGSEPRQGQQMGLQDPNAGKNWKEQQVGPMIESGAKAVGEAIDQRANKNINEAARELSRIAKGESEPYQGNIRQYLMNNPEALKRLSPADLQRLQQRYGERFINQFL